MRPLRRLAICSCRGRPSRQEARHADCGPSAPRAEMSLHRPDQPLQTAPVPASAHTVRSSAGAHSPAPRARAAPRVAAGRSRGVSRDVHSRLTTIGGRRRAVVRVRDIANVVSVTQASPTLRHERPVMTRSPGTRRNSASFPVATLNPCASAVAAIQRSCAPTASTAASEVGPHLCVHAGDGLRDRDRFEHGDDMLHERAPPGPRISSRSMCTVKQLAHGNDADRAVLVSQ